MRTERLQKQLQFLYEIDKLKMVFRKANLISDPERFENTAEHSWHLALYAILLSEYANEKINLCRVIKMVLLHDLVEIDAGDTFGYDDAGHADKHEREMRAAKRLFGLLPEDQQHEFMGIWQEFEACQTPEAQFALAVDRLQPVLHNYVTGGGSWRRHDIKRSQVEKRMQPVAEGSEVLADLVNSVLDDAVKKNILVV